MRRSKVTASCPCGATMEISGVSASIVSSMAKSWMRVHNCTSPDAAPSTQHGMWYSKVTTSKEG